LKTPEATEEHPGQEPDFHEGEYTHAQIMRILVGLMMGMFLGSLDQTIVSTAIRTIADDLHGLSVQAWVTTAYLITSTIATPIYGKLGDMWGRKKLFMFAITVFVIGSALCAFSTSMHMLAAFRAIQGIGAGGLFTLSLAIIGDIVAPRERAKYSGYMMAMFGSSSVLGPVIGGLFAGATTILGVAGWRWVFLVNVPLGIMALYVVWRTLHLQTTRRHARVDWMGASALVIALVPLLTVLEQGREWGWGSQRSLLCFALATVGVIGFVLIEARMQGDALIPLSIFRIRAASVTITASVIVGMAMFGGMMILPLYMQIVHDASPMKSGFMMLPMVLGLMFASALSGQITSRTGKIRSFPMFGSLIMAVSLLLLSTIDADTELLHVMLIMSMLGFGLGNCMQPLLIILQNAVPPQQIGVATSSATFFRQIGGTIGVAIFLSVLFSTVGANITTEFQHAAKDPAFQSALKDPQVLAEPANREVAETLSGKAQDGGVFAKVQDDSSIIKEMNPIISHPFRAGFAESMSVVFLYAGYIGLVAFLILLFIPKVTLRSQSAAAAAREQVQESS
jgi:EmrB/QacA subfamily drug resistance transporter